jgi:geranylgeranyl reductase family protein
MFDCIIVGAGPAGGTASYHLAKRGYSVLILDKQSLPRYKPCGGGVSPEIAQWFDFDFSPAISQKVTQIRYTWKMGDPVDVSLDESQCIWMVRRNIFDHFLVKQAQNQGAELRDKTEVTGIEFKSDSWQVKTADQVFSARYLIAADGSMGPMVKLLNFKQRKRLVCGAFEIEPSFPVQPADPPVLHLELGMLQNGYAWNFPKADGYSIGAGIFRGNQKKVPNLRECVISYANHFGVEMTSMKHYGHPIFAWNGSQILHTQNAVLAGEAACVVDPFTAEGIRPSMFSGLKAAEAIAAALSGDLDALPRYTQVMDEE